MTNPVIKEKDPIQVTNKNIIMQLKELIKQNDEISKNKIFGMKEKADLLTIKFKIL